MKGKIKAFVLPVFILLAVALLLFTSLYIYSYYTIPKNFYAINGEKTIVAECFPCKGEIPGENTGTGVKKVRLNFCGVPLKEVSVSVIGVGEVSLGGFPFGIKMYTDGVMVVSIADIQADSAVKNPAYEAGLRIKDIITKIDGEKISSIEQLAEIVEKSQGKKLELTVKRSDMVMKFSAAPLISRADGKYKLGVWVRDSSAGIGTMTYFDEKSGLAGLGHGICDVDTGQTLPLSYGSVMKASIADIQKGQKGSPGELKGILYDNVEIGKLYDNCECGIFGILSESGKQRVCGKKYKIALSPEIKKGPATIFCTLDENGAREYDVEIESINKLSYFGQKNMVIKITDPELLEKTGGIVQGMSGSPIVQNGKLVGAVTHVFVSDPAKGYGIFAENMIKSSYNKLSKDKAS